MWRIILRASDKRVVDDFMWDHPVFADAPPTMMEIPGGGRFTLRVTSERTAFYVQEPA